MYKLLMCGKIISIGRNAIRYGRFPKIVSMEFCAIMDAIAESAEKGKRVTMQ